MATVSSSEIEQYAREFDDLTNSRMQFGQEKYGSYTWLDAPTWDMMVEELADMVNYARMCAVKIRLIQSWIQGELDNQTPDDRGFVPNNPGKE